MTKFSLESETSKVSLGIFPTLYVTIVCSICYFCHYWFWRLPVSSWKTNLYTTLQLFHYFFSLRERILTQKINSTNRLHSVMPKGLSLLCKVHICHSQFLVILKVLFLPSYFCACVSIKSSNCKCYRKTIQIRSNGEKVPEAGPGFFLGGGAPLRNGVTDWSRKQIVDCMTEKLNILKVSQVPVMHLLSLTASWQPVTT